MSYSDFVDMYNINTYYPTGWQTTDYYFTREQLYQEYNWYRYLIKDPEFVHAVYEKWEEIRPTVIEDMIKEGKRTSNHTPNKLKNPANGYF